MIIFKRMKEKEGMMNMSNKDFITEEHLRKRQTFRTIGPLVLGAGILCSVIAAVDFFGGFSSINSFDSFDTIDSFNSFETVDSFGGPKYFWLFFVGFPLIALGASLCKLGYGADLAKYQSRELAPVAKDTFNYLANETTEGVETITRAVQKGKSTVVEAKVCSYCQELNKIDAKFCNECGQAL